jgi:hypothetical protein
MDTQINSTFTAQAPVALFLLFAGVLAAGVACVGCSRPSLPEVRFAQRVRPQCPPSSGYDFFFPTESAPSAAWYSRYLAAAGAPSLSCGDTPREGYRFLRIPSFRSAVVISVFRLNTGWSVEALEFADSKRDRWTVAKRTTRALTEGQIQELRGALRQAEFWTRTAWYSPEVNDATSLIIEGRENSAYRVVGMVGTNDPAFDGACTAFVQLAGVPSPKSVSQ